MPPLSLLLKPASSLCNLHCRYCFYSDEAAARLDGCYGLMTVDTLSQVLRHALAAAEGHCVVGFQGGEPTLAGLKFFQRAVALERVHNIHGVRLENTLQTNGMLLDRAWAKFLAEESFLVGLSLDGVRKTHNALRGEGTFQRVMESANLLQAQGVPLNILTVVTAYTAGQIERIYAFYRKCGFTHLQFIPCLEPLDAAAGFSPYALSPQEYGEFLCKLFDLWYADWKRGEAPSIRQFENYASVLLGLEPEACGQRGGCYLQSVVEADGSVYPCDFYALDGFCLGNLARQEFHTLDFDGVGRSFLSQGLVLPGACRACQWLPLCRGGCRRDRLLPSGMYGENRLCAGLRLFFQHALPRLRHAAGADALNP